jgi:beta-N-acetylhexosaminidase
MTDTIRSVAMLVAAGLLLASCASGPGTTEEEDADRRFGFPETETPALPEAAPPDVVEKALATMTLEQLIGQRFVTWLEGTKVTPEERRLAVDGLVGGFIIYPQNVEDRRQLAGLTGTLQRFARRARPPVELFLAADQEGGRVAALRLDDMPRFPAFRDWARHDDAAYIEAAAYVMNTELRSVGINMNFAPVLDVYEHADESIIGDRALGDDPALVARLGQAYLTGARQAGVIAVPKHFPGHGSTSVDSHGRLPVVELSRDELYDRHLRPFEVAVDAGAEAVMTAHLLLPVLDDAHPVTLSRPVIDGLLREKLAFGGVVISDGVAMGAISRNYSIPEAIELSIEAGIDIILVHARYDISEMIATTVDLVEAGRISVDRLTEGTRRVLELKARHGLLGDSPSGR